MNKEKKKVIRKKKKEQEMAKDGTTVLEGLSSSEEGNPLRPILCKRKDDIKLFEETEDCFILDFDPFESIYLSNKLSQTAKDVTTVLEFLSSSEQGSPLRPILCKREADIKLFEETEDCFILDFDPFESIDLANKLSLATIHDGGNTDVSIIAENGQVACRDYPHSRHLCLKFPFDEIPHESYCEQCYCYVCDSNAPCKYWRSKLHCHATEKNSFWRDLRRSEGKKPVPMV